MRSSILLSKCSAFILCVCSCVLRHCSFILRVFSFFLRLCSFILRLCSFILRLCYGVCTICLLSHSARHIKGTTCRFISTTGLCLNMKPKKEGVHGNLFFDNDMMKFSLIRYKASYLGTRLLVRFREIDNQ